MATWFVWLNAGKQVSRHQKAAGDQFSWRWRCSSRGTVPQPVKMSTRKSRRVLLGGPAWLEFVLALILDAFQSKSPAEEMCLIRCYCTDADQVRLTSQGWAADGPAADQHHRPLSSEPLHRADE